MNPHSPEAWEAREKARVQRLALCEHLGLDADQTTNVTVRFNSGSAMVSWEGARRLSPDEVSSLLTAIGAVE